MAISDRVAVLRKGKYIGDVTTAETDPQAPDRDDGGPGGEPEHRPARAARTADRVWRSKSLDRLQRRGRQGAGRRQPSTPTAARSWASPASPAPARRSCWRPSPACSMRPAGSDVHSIATSPADVRWTSAEELVGKTPLQIQQDAGVSMAFVPEDRLGMGLVGSHGHDRQHDAQELPGQRQGPLCGPQGPQGAGQAGHGGAGGRHPRHRTPRCGACPAATCRRCWWAGRLPPLPPC